MTQPIVTVYGSTTCTDTVRAADYLESMGVAYEFRDVDVSPEDNEYIAGLNGGKRVMPTILVGDEALINPSDEELVRALEGAAQE